MRLVLQIFVATAGLVAVLTSLGLAKFVLLMVGLIFLCALVGVIIRFTKNPPKQIDIRG